MIQPSLWAFKVRRNTNASPRSAAPMLMQNPRVIGWFSTEDDDYPVPRTESIFIPANINSSFSHRSDLGHSSRLQFSLATLDVSLRFGAKIVNSDDTLNQFMHQCD